MLLGYAFLFRLTGFYFENTSTFEFSPSIFLLPSLGLLLRLVSIESCSA